MAELVYQPVIRLVKTFWKYLDLRFTFYGQAHIPAKGPAILAMNHIGYLDFAIAGTAVLPSGRLVRFMAKKELFTHPITGPLMRGMKHIKVDRENGGPSFVAALKALHKGEIVGIFPEATISQSFDLKDMKSGVIRLARESGAPILPTVIWGSQRIWTKKVPRDLKRKSYPIFVSIGAPIYVNDGESNEVCLNRLFAAMQELLNELHKDYPDSPIGQRWAPASLGGTAPTKQELAIQKMAKADEKRKEL